MNCETENMIYQNECCQIQGAISDAHKEIGAGFLEAVYDVFFSFPFILRKRCFYFRFAMDKGRVKKQSFVKDGGIFG